MGCTNAYASFDVYKTARKNGKVLESSKGIGFEIFVHSLNSSIIMFTEVEWNS